MAERTPREVGWTVFRERVQQHVAYLHEISEVYELTMQGVEQLASSGPLVTALRNLDLAAVRIEQAREAPSLLTEPAGVGEQPGEDLEEAKYRNKLQRVELAMKHFQAGLPTLKSHTAVAYWGAVEAFVEDVVRTWIEYFADELEAEALDQKVSVRFGEFLGLSDEDRSWLLLHRLQDALRTGVRSGIGPTLQLLACCGLRPQLGDDERKALHELAHVRNLIVHRASIVDRRLAEACPWLKLDVGERFIVTAQSLRSYADSTAVLMTSVISEAAERRRQRPI